MRGESELLLGQLETSRPIVLINPHADGLYQTMAARNQAPERIFSQDFATWRQLPAAVSEFGALARGEALKARCVVLFLPREKARLRLLLEHIGRHLGADGECWLVGHNQAGIKSAGQLMAQYFSGVETVAAARHCRLYRACGPIMPDPPFRWSDWAESIPRQTADPWPALISYPGVFAHGAVDAATRLLLDTITDKPPADGTRVLDFGCGCGIVGLTLLSAQPGLRLDMVDSYALALQAARENADTLGLRARVIASDGLSDVDGPYDLIVSNPPFHQGVDQDLSVTRGLIEQTGAVLRPDGRLVLVANVHLPYRGWLEPWFRQIHVAARTRSFQVLSASI